MILYLDTSALVKLYVQESGRELVEGAVACASVITTTLITYAETRATFAKVQRMGIWSESEVAAAVTQFAQDWRHVERLAVDEDLVLAAGELAARYGLRGYDAIHLASTLRATQVGMGVTFASFDLRLLNAAAAEG